MCAFLRFHMHRSHSSSITTITILGKIRYGFWLITIFIEPLNFTDMLRHWFVFFVIFLSSLFSLFFFVSHFATTRWSVWVRARERVWHYFDFSIYKKLNEVIQMCINVCTHAHRAINQEINVNVRFDLSLCL